MIGVPEVVRSKAAQVGADRWLDGLPDLVSGLAADWAFEPVRPLDGGTGSYILEVRRTGGAPAVLKLLVPGETDLVAHEITVLRLVGGEACPRLLRHDVDRGAILMERLGRRLADCHVPVRRRHEILCATAQRIWRPAADCGLPTGADEGRRLVELITATWEELDRPIPAATIDHAIACAGRRIAAHDDERARLVHGDVHQWNALQSADGFALVDPDGLVAEPEHDLGAIMREDPRELLEEGPWGRAQRLAALTGLDVTAIWEWGVVQRVATGLLCTQVELQPVGREMLAAAVVVARG